MKARTEESVASAAKESRNAPQARSFAALSTMYVCGVSAAEAGTEPPSTSPATAAATAVTLAIRLETRISRPPFAAGK